MFLREVVTGKKTSNPVRYARIVESYLTKRAKCSSASPRVSALFVGTICQTWV
jgi:hypothetical protein